MQTAILWDAEVYPLLFAVAGVLVAISLRRQPVCWLMLLVGGCFAANAAALQWLATGSTTAASGVDWWAERGSAVLIPATLLLALLLPDGRLPSALAASGGSLSAACRRVGPLADQGRSRGGLVTERG